MRHLQHTTGRSTQEWYTPAENAAIARQWTRGPLRALVPRLNRSESSISTHARRLVRAGTLDPLRQWKRTWTEAEDDLLREHYGMLPDGQLARRLRRRPGALRSRVHTLALRRREQHLTASDLARILGVDTHRVGYLAAHGWLELQRAQVGALNRRWWTCTEQAFRRFLAGHPAQYEWRRIADEPWRALGRAAHERADFLTTADVAALKGCSSDWVVRACRSGALPCERATTHGGTGQFLIRRADAERWAGRGQGGKPVPVRGVRLLRVRQREPVERPVRFAPVAWRAS